MWASRKPAAAAELDRLATTGANTDVASLGPPNLRLPAPSSPGKLT